MNNSQGPFWEKKELIYEGRLSFVRGEVDAESSTREEKISSLEKKSDA